MAFVIPNQRTELLVDQKEAKAGTFTPALGNAGHVSQFDKRIRFLTREAKWRSMLVSQIAPKAGESILDVGCGTGTLAVALKAENDDALITGIDPDPEALVLARKKADAVSVEAVFSSGFAHDAAAEGREGRFDHVVSSLVFHQVPIEEKRAGLAAMKAAAKPNGFVHIADFGRQRWPFERVCFLITQHADGYADTEPNARGILDELIDEIRLERIHKTKVMTPTGSISLWKLRRRSV